MKILQGHAFIKVIRFLDIVLLVIAFWVADTIVNKPFSFNHLLRLNLSDLTFFGVVFFSAKLFSWKLIFKIIGLYEFKHSRSIKEEIWLVLKSVVISLVIVIILKIITSEKVSRMSLLLFICSGFLLMVLLRYFAFYITKTPWYNRVRYVLIAGTGKRAQEYAKMILNTPESNYVIRGYADTYWHGDNLEKNSIIRIVTDFNNLSEYLRGNVIDEIFVFLPIKTHYQNICNVIEAAEEQGVIVRMSTDIFNLKFSKSKLEYFEDKPLITIVNGKMYNRSVLIKSTVDFIVALILLILFAPLLLVISVIIKLSSSGPIFFLQPRIGINKRVFKMIKFRTMVVDAEKNIDKVAHLNDRKNEPVFKIKNDPRITRIGKILRKFSLDELPQFINVLRGEMSIVGPRPLPIRDYNGFETNWQRRRFSVKPGITCIWQISGRDNIPFEKWMKMDLEYIDNWSLWLDFKIMLKTVPVCIFKVGAD